MPRLGLGAALVTLLVFGGWSPTPRGGGSGGSSTPNVVSTFSDLTDAATITIACPAITKRKSGTVLVMAQMSTSPNGTGTFYGSLSMNLDGTQLPSTPGAGTSFFSSNATQSSSVINLVTLPDSNPHTISVTATPAGGGTIRASTGVGPLGAGIICLEL